MSGAGWWRRTHRDTVLCIGSSCVLADVWSLWKRQIAQSRPIGSDRINSSQRAISSSGLACPTSSCEGLRKRMARPSEICLRRAGRSGRRCRSRPFYTRWPPPFPKTQRPSLVRRNLWKSEKTRLYISLPVVTTLCRPRPRDRAAAEVRNVESRHARCLR